MDNINYQTHLKANKEIITYEISDDESSDENLPLVNNKAKSSKEIMRICNNLCESGNQSNYKTAEGSLQSPDQNNDQKRQHPLFSWFKPKNESLRKNTNRNEVKKISQPTCSWEQLSDDSLEFDEQSPQEKKPKLACLDTEISEDELDDKILEESSKEVPRVQIHYKTKVEGIFVEMPVKPYLCQQQLMEYVIKGCNTEQNCLLESPTGSGKTLALLCGTLAWQADYKKQLDAEALRKASLELTETAPEQPQQCKVVDELSLDDIDPSEWDSVDMKDFGKKPPTKKMPKIYYGSRTHRQIEQVVDELKKTIYRDTKMTLLSSRDQSCIQSSTRNKTELCNELLDPTKRRGCPFYNDKNKSALTSFASLKLHGVDSPWQIEDLVTAAKESDLCAYFAARGLVQDADIVFCPYNYIIDPKIRESLNLDLRNAIIILDEAHNMEDICRESGSVSVPIGALETIITDCEGVVASAASAKKLHLTACISVVSDYCERLKKLIETTTLAPKKGAFDVPTSDQWTGNELLEKFQINNINKSVTANFIVAVRDVINQFKISKESRYPPIQIFTVNADSVRKLEGILMALHMVQSPAHAPDYRIVIKMVTIGFKREKSLEFMCMNPGVIFRPLCVLARSVILASGTLSPTSSFAGELGVEFPFTLQANHVTPPDQVFIKCITKGANGHPLKATYNNVNNWAFQEALGNTLITVCNAVPHGILVFFSSYSVMDSVTKRWADNNMHDEMAKRKTIFRETRGSGDLNNMMRDYRQCIKDTSNGSIDGEINGAMLLAVFRGKVAEGIDFSDNEARAVVTIGIPYSVISDPAIDMKVRYNDANRNKNLLNGRAWYTCQAFRALNQALGRAIRHQNDWGAIILVDERLIESSSVNHLPGWVRSMWAQQKDSKSDLATSLQNFVAKQKQREQDKK